MENGVNAPSESVHRFLQCLPVGDDSPVLAALFAGESLAGLDIAKSAFDDNTPAALTPGQKAELFTQSLQKLLPELAAQSLQQVTFHHMLQWQPITSETQSNSCAEISLIEAQCQPANGSEFSLLFLLIQPKIDSENLPVSVCYLQTESLGKVFPALFADMFESLSEILRQQNLSLQQLIPISAWQLNLCLDAVHLQYFDIREFSKTLIAQLAMPETNGQQLYMVLSELFSNALEHGILELDQALKEEATGFLQYYRQRDERISTLTEGNIKLAISFAGSDQQNSLHISVTDTGKGFDFSHKPPTFDGKQRASGRGTALVKALCDDIHFCGNGNSVEVTYHW